MRPPVHAGGFSHEEAKNPAEPGRGPGKV